MCLIGYKNKKKKGFGAAGNLVLTSNAWCGNF